VNSWDESYTLADYRYGTAPNAFLVEQAARLPAGAQVLVPGDGEGRNGVWLAKQGHRVTAVDGSAVGLDKARRLAAQEEVRLETVLADLATWSPQPASADAVILTFVHLPPDIRTDVHQRLARALKSGGLLILEAFHTAQLNYTSGGPARSDMLYSLSTVRFDLADALEELVGWEGEAMLDEGPGHQGVAYVTRWIGRAGPAGVGRQDTGPQ
jgi:SAM-dependent methyltransferase